MGQVFSSDEGCLPANADNASEDTMTGVGVWLKVDNFGSAYVRGMVEGG